MNENIDNRYARLLGLSSFNEKKLQVLQSKRILIIGVGGVGQSVATSLITNGIKHLTIVDFDVVELSNLNRQILLKEEDVGQEKIKVVLRELLKKNSEADITAFNMKVDDSNIDLLLKNIDVVVDAVDNWSTKLVLGKACAEHKLPFLHIGVDGHKGQYCLFEKKSLLDVFDEKIKKEPRDGVMGPMVISIASLAALHLLNYLIGDASPDILYYFDSVSSKLGSMKIEG